MGIQSWKRGLHSGNTVRRGDPFIAKNQREPAGLVRRNFAAAPTTALPVVNSQYTTDEEPKKSRRRGRRTKKTKQSADSDNSYESVSFDELNNFQENVFYSLNKKGRWNLPEEIRREITHTNRNVKGLFSKVKFSCAALFSEHFSKAKKGKARNIDLLL